MAEARRNYMILFVAKKRSGKTTRAKRIAELNPNPIIVVTTDLHPSYADYEQITVEQLKTWKGRRCQVVCRDESETLEAADILNKYVSNCFVIFEDATKYVSLNVQDSFNRLIINHRMRGLDIVFMFHSLKFVPNKIANNFDMLWLFKTNDGRVNLSTKFGNWDKIEERKNWINQNPDPYYCEVIHDYD